MLTNLTIRDKSGNRVVSMTADSIASLSAVSTDAMDYARRSMKAYRASVRSASRGNLYYFQWIESYRGFKAIVLGEAK